MSTSVYLAGMEVDRFFECAMRMRSKHCLATYWGLKSKPDYIKQKKDLNPEVKFLIDSGAFTFFNKEVQSIDYYKRYRDQYIKYIEKNKDYVHGFAELDIDPIIGDEAKRWREDIFQPLARKIPIIFIYHENVMRPEDWLRYCKKYEYVGIGSGYKSPTFHPVMSVARKYLTKVHAFGFTRSTEIQQYDFYSVDSTTWLLGSKHGETDVFDVKSIRRFDNKKKDVRRRYKNKFEKAGLSWEKISNEEYYEIIKMNMLAFIEMHEYLAKANRLKAYWDKKLERPRLVSQYGESECDAALVDKIGYEKEQLEGLPFVDKKERCVLFSQLQWGVFKEIKRYLESVQRSDVEEVFGVDVSAKVADLLNATDEELDAMRTTFNSSLLRIAPPITRLNLADYKPTKPVSKREPDNTLCIDDDKPDLDNVNLFYK